MTPKTPPPPPVPDPIEIPTADNPQVKQATRARLMEDEQSREGRGSSNLVSSVQPIYSRTRLG